MTGLPARRPIVIAHRGGAAEAPENTVAAFERAIALGYPGVEFDVRLSRDGVPVVVHDSRVRTAPSMPLRAVHDLPASELLALPTLDSVLSMPWGPAALMVEVKPTHRDRDLGSLAARAVAARGLLPQAVLASFSRAVLEAAGEAAPGLRIMGLVDDQTRPGLFDGLSLFGFGVDRRLLPAAARTGGLESWKEGGRELWTWTIKTLGEMREALQAGVDGLITDIPGQVLERL